MSKKLFVGGLSWGTDDAMFHDAFARFGSVTEAKVILDRDTGRSRGFGFVTYTDGSAADAAIQAMDGTELDGRTIRVNEAQERSRGGDDRRRDSRW
ncbi:MAG: RNA-binding protein [Alphaproteobacteria bacterium]|nr:RNA-binding protein [Alphaproteobacteria bacterium]